METVVVRHTLEEDAGAYRVVLADAEQVAEQMLDERGRPVAQCREGICDGSGVVMRREAPPGQPDPDQEQAEGAEMPEPLEEVELPEPCPSCEAAGGPEPVLELRTVLSNPRDVLFAADDERWFADGERRPHDEVAAEQRAEVADALRAQAEEAEAEERRRREATTDLLGDEPVAL